MGIRCGFEAVADLATANLRLSHLASLSPGEYFIFNLQSHRVSTRLVSTNEPEKHDPVKSHHYDIVRREDNKPAIWLEVAHDLNIAELRIHDLASFWPGEFQIIDQQNHQVVRKFIGSPDRSQDQD